MGILGKIFTWWDGATIGTHLGLISARRVGDDALGNVYYLGKTASDGSARRQVVYGGANDASRVPPEWHAWLHHQVDTLPDTSLPPPRRWEKESKANATGTVAAYRPSGGVGSWRRACCGYGRLRSLDARRVMKPAAVIGAALAAVGVAVAAPMVGNLASPAETSNGSAPADEPAKIAKHVDPDPKLQTGDTPMAERIATLGILNKRNGLSRDIQMKPGQAVRIGDLVVRLKACETSQDWEAEQITGSFVQVLVENPTGGMWRKVFSGWLFKETPSLNVVEHPVYDVWTKACKMRHADVGPDTVTVSDSDRSTSRSSAPKSPDDEAADAASPPVTATAASSNSI